MVFGRLIWIGIFGFVLSACEGVTTKEDGTETVSLQGTLTQVTALQTEADCSNGGVTLEHGIDLNGDGTLEEDEITHTYVICHGEDGQDANNDEVTAQLDALRVELDALKAVVQLNTAKVGVSQEQADQIAENTTTLTDLGNHSAFDGWDKSAADDANYLTEETDPVASAAGYLLVETDPVASAAGYLLVETDPVASAAGYLLVETDPVASAAGYLTSFTETDPVASAAGYLTSFTETDPVASAAGYLTSETDPVASAAGYLTSETDPVASAAGYLTSFTETDPIANNVLSDLGNHDAFIGWDKDESNDVEAVTGLTDAQTDAIEQIAVIEAQVEILARDNYSNFDAADFDWDMLREFNYLTSFIETDPVASAAGYLTVEEDPVASAAGYLTSYTETDPVASSTGYLTADSDLLYMFGDYDSDSVVNIEDNCAFESNTNQVDADRDGKGDLCDSTTPATIMSTDSTLMFTRCPAGIDFLDGFMYCRANWEQEGTHTFQYCSSTDNTCNSESTGALNGYGESELYLACADLELDGHNDWRVPNREEMTIWASDIFANDFVGSNEWTSVTFWTSEVYSDSSGYVYDKNANEFYAALKTEHLQVYCVRDVLP